MRKVVDYLKPETIILNLKSKDKKGIIKEIFDSLSTVEEIIDKEKCYLDLLEREKLGSTGIGEGFAIPHAKTDAVKDLVMTVAISKTDIEYESIDNSKVNVFFMFLSPTELSQEYLTLLAKISRFIRDKEFLKQLLEAQTKEEIINILGSKEN